MVLRHNGAFGDLINDVTEIYKLVTVHTDLQMCQRKFRSMKYTRRYSYTKFGTFFMGHPVVQLRWHASPLAKYNSLTVMETRPKR